VERQGPGQLSEIANFNCNRYLQICYARGNRRAGPSYRISLPPRLGTEPPVST
jgi:hypothetical protein